MLNQTFRQHFAVELLKHVLVLDVFEHDHLINETNIDTISLCFFLFYVYFLFIEISTASYMNSQLG